MRKPVRKIEGTAGKEVMGKNAYVGENGNRLRVMGFRSYCFCIFSS
jgi:hypothetical protein